MSTEPDTTHHTGPEDPGGGNGGGGHPVVAAISFKPEELERARQAATEIVETLRK